MKSGETPYPRMPWRQRLLLLGGIIGCVGIASIVLLVWPDVVLMGLSVVLTIGLVVIMGDLLFDCAERLATGWPFVQRQRGQSVSASFDLPTFVAEPIQQRVTDRQLADLLAPCLPVIDTRALVQIDDQGMRCDPLVFVDASQQPGVADLPRVQRIEGEGEVTYGWAYANLDRIDALALFNCTSHVPVKAHIRLAFPLRVAAGFLETIGIAQQLHLVPCVGEQIAAGASRLFSEDIEGLRIDLDATTTQELLERVRQWRERYPTVSGDVLG